MDYADYSYKERLEEMSNNGECMFECHGCPVTWGGCADRGVLMKRAKRVLDAGHPYSHYHEIKINKETP